MRKSKTITIDDMRITVYEVIVSDLLELLKADTREVTERAADYLPKCTDLTLEKMKTMSPSELKAVWDAFSEVNDVFFSAISTLGVYDAVIREVKAAVEEEMEKQRAAGPSTGPPLKSGSSPLSPAAT